MNFFFNADDKSFTVITRYGFIWKQSPEKYRLSFKKFLLDNSYFIVDSMWLLCQLTGIPIGFDPSPFMEKFILYYYQRKWFFPTKKGDLRKVCTFSNIFRVINDFQNNSKDIYRDDAEVQK